MEKASARAGANIAFVKYWGRRDPALNLPLNNSISMTLDNAVTLTTVAFVAGLPADSFSLNGEPAAADALRRVSRHLDRLRTLAGTDLRARVASRNTFPTGAGIASSASGFAALTVAAAAALGLDLRTDALSRLARLASGSACRSLYGGYVEWLAGTGDEDSLARQLAPAGHWPLVDVVAVVSTTYKPVPSEAGHALAGSSPFLAARLDTLDETLAACRDAIRRRDLPALGAVAEADALSMHAVAMTSQPPAWYWSCGTLAVLEALRAWRAEGLPVYFTIDAGPNVHLLTLPAYAGEVVARLAAMPEAGQSLVCGPGPGAALVDEHLF